MAKKATKKKTAKKAVKVEPKIVYIDKSKPMTEHEIDHALNVPEEDLQRKAIMQIINNEFLTTQSAVGINTSNYGDMAYAAGLADGARMIRDNLKDRYESAMQNVLDNIKQEPPPPTTNSY